MADGTTAGEALRLIADASAALAGSLELDDVLAAIGRIAVPRLGDACLIDLDAFGDERPERRLVASSLPPDVAALARDYLARFRAAELAPDQTKSLANGEPLVFANLGDTQYVRSSHSVEQLVALRALHPRAALLVPLLANGRKLGAMLLVSTGDDRQPSEADVALARELGHRVAQALLNARLYAVARQSEERLTLALEGAEQGFWDWDLPTNRIYADRRLCAMLGRSSDELGRTPEDWSHVIHPSDAARVREEMRDHLEGRTPRFESEHRIIHADGTWHWVLSRCRVVEHDASGRPRRVAGTHTDVTTRRRADEARQVLAHAVEGSQDFVATIGPNGRLTYVNAAGVRLLGAADASEIVGRHHTELHPSDELPKLDEIRRALLQGSGAWRGEYHLLPFDGGAPVPVEVHEFAVRDEETGDLVAIACIGRDLRERNAAAEERERLGEQARHAQRVESLGVLAGGVAHDFNNLLTVILSAADLVRGDLAVEHPAQPDLTAIREAAARASQLTRQLLAFSRRQVFESKLLDLNAVVEGADAILRRLLGERVTFDTVLADERLPVHADPVQLEQALVNLVLNARDAVASRPEGGMVTMETAAVTLGADAAARQGVSAGPYVSISVHDTGVGMDAETRARAFEPFFTTKPVGQGTGLGLSMVYGIVTQSGGAVTVDSAPGRGTTFHVLLPMADDDDDLLDSRDDSAAPSTSGRETILLVEDEAAVRNVARRILERAGYTVYEARHGADALLVWNETGGASGPIDVLLTDVRMPEMGGRELAAALRRERPDLPVVFVSGYADPAPHFASHGTASGAHHEPSAGRDRFVAKPFVAPDLLRAVRHALDARWSGSACEPQGGGRGGSRPAPTRVLRGSTAEHRVTELAFSPVCTALCFRDPTQYTPALAACARSFPLSCSSRPHPSPPPSHRRWAPASRTSWRPIAPHMSPTCATTCGST
jgi:PAS domain S-box-containing protein